MNCRRSCLVVISDPRPKVSSSRSARETFMMSNCLRSGSVDQIAACRVPLPTHGNSGKSRNPFRCRVRRRCKFSPPSSDQAIVGTVSHNGRDHDRAYSGAASKRRLSAVIERQPDGLKNALREGPRWYIQNFDAAQVDHQGVNLEPGEMHRSGLISRLTHTGLMSVLA